VTRAIIACATAWKQSSTHRPKRGLIEEQNGSALRSTPTPFTINSGFVSGLNTIHVTVDNGGDPTAFFVEFNTATAGGGSGVPEPSAILLTCAGLAGLLTLRRPAGRPR